MKTFPKPFINDVTLRDGNQSLRRPWNIQEKKEIFQKLVELGVNGAELGFASSGEMDFQACSEIAKMSPPGVRVSSLSRAVEKEIEISYRAISHAPEPCIHIVYPISEFAIHNVLKISHSEVLANIKNAIRFARKLSNPKTSIQFSGEHFGDCGESMDFAKEAFDAAIQEGADIINLPNTVERTRPFLFVKMVSEISEEFRDRARISVHTHNDLGMATACTVESFFAGAEQLEVTLNGIGERAGNTNLFEVVTALFLSGIKLDIHMDKIYPISKYIEQISEIKLSAKAPLVGEEVFSHRSGIHQDGVIKTSSLSRNLYGAIDPETIGRRRGHRLEFTNQSGSHMIRHILKNLGHDLSDSESRDLLNVFKNESDRVKTSLDEEIVLQKYLSIRSEAGK